LDFLVIDDAFDADTHAKISNFLSLPTWSFGWCSNPRSDQFAFWHKHFASSLRADHLEGEGEATQNDCVAEFKLNAPPIYDLWPIRRKWPKSVGDPILCRLQRAFRPKILASVRVC